MGLLAHSLKACSKARQHVLDGPRKNAVLLDMPLWHNSVFKNSKSNTYYCPSLIRTGVTRVSHLCNDALVPNDSIIAKLATTWRPVYRGSLSSYSQLPISLWSLPSTWSTAWGTSAFLKKAASLAPTNTRQEPQVWASFWTSKFPPSILSFVYQVLWKKLKVGDRLKSWTQQPKCPVCHRLETVEHAVHSCAFHPLIHDTIEQMLGNPPKHSSGEEHRVATRSKVPHTPCGGNALGSACGALACL